MVLCDRVHEDEVRFGQGGIIYVSLGNTIRYVSLPREGGAE